MFQYIKFYFVILFIIILFGIVQRFSSRQSISDTVCKIVMLSGEIRNRE